ncbi:hypothetical protein HY383_01725 [Candidatus Daviesbacteria bacterium]|nr:hypothetical protein [Candidatus Daviesbacteria bacterium]
MLKEADRGVPFADIWVAENLSRVGEMIPRLMDAIAIKCTHPDGHIAWTAGTTWGPVHGFFLPAPVGQTVQEQVWVTPFAELGWLNGNINNQDIKYNLRERLGRYTYLWTPALPDLQISHIRGSNGEHLLFFTRDLPIEPDNPFVNSQSTNGRVQHHLAHSFAPVLV